MTRIHSRPLIEVDVLIVGSGLVGATFARTIADMLPRTRILMIDSGPLLDSQPGVNVRNIVDRDRRTRAQLASQGPTPFRYDSSNEETPNVSPARLEALSLLARPGTFLLNPKPECATDFPAAAASCNVGGMGAHWTCSCPRPSDSECIPFIAKEEMDLLLKRAEELLDVRKDIFPESEINGRIAERLGMIFDAPNLRPVEPMPTAGTVLSSGERIFTGSGTVLGNWAEQLYSKTLGCGPRLRSDTICRRLLLSGDKVTGAVVSYLPTGIEEEIRARFVVIAADSLRSPQLLWASGIRMPALGHYLNEHPQILSAVGYVPATNDAATKILPSKFGVIWIPFSDRHHPFHGQIRARGYESYKAVKALTLVLCWYCRKDIQFEDCIEFSETDQDHYNMPAPRIRYQYTELDKETIVKAIYELRRAANLIGSFLEGEEPLLQPAGRSLHYQGTMRMGALDDGSSVCNTFSQPWSYKNLFVGGNGVIPTSTACNSTLTSVALAIRAAAHLVALLK